LKKKQEGRTGGKGTREKQKAQLKIALVCERENTRESESEGSHQGVGQGRNASVDGT